MSYTKITNEGMNFRQINDSVTANSPNPPTRNHTDSSQSYQWLRQFVGNYNPSWRDQVKRQIGATTSSNGTSFNVLSTPYISGIVNIINIHDPRTYRFYSVLGTPLLSLPSQISMQNTADNNTKNHAKARAITSFLNKAKSEISSFESGQDIAELHQTIESVIHPLASLKKYVASYFTSLKKVKNKYKSKVSLKKALADTYLEWTFGWNPLAADIADGIVGLSRFRFSSVPISAHAGETYSSFQQSTTTSLSDAAYKYDRRIRSRFTYRLKGVVNPYYSKQPRVLQELQLLPEDFLPTSWDLLPYSFVSDYFTNIGDIIRAFSFPSAAIRWCNSTDRDVTKTFIQYGGDPNYVQLLAGLLTDWSTTQEIFSTNFDVEYTIFIRNFVTPSSLMPPLVLTIPPLSSKPWENIAALLTGNAKRLSPFY